MKSHRSTLIRTHVALVLFLAGSLEAQTPPPAEHAAALIRKNDLVAAESVLAPLTGEQSTDAAAFFQLGALRLRQQRPDDAAIAYEKAAKLDPTKPEYFSQHAIALSAMMPGASLMTQATLATKMKKAFEKSVALDPNHIAGLIGLARFYVNAPEIAGGSLEKAREFAERVQALNPFLGAIELGTVAEHGEDFAAALTHFDAASKLRPTHAGPHAAAGRVLTKLGRHDEARDRLQRARELEPKRNTTR